MYPTVDESQAAMIVDLIPRIFGRREKMVLKPMQNIVRVAAFATVLFGTAAWAQQDPKPAAGPQSQPAAGPQSQPAAGAQSKPASAELAPVPPAPNAFRAVTDFMGITTESGEAPEFIRQTRPDADKMDYSHLTGVDKPRVAVKTPEQVEADKAALIAIRDGADARRKKLQGEKMEAVAPNKAPPPEPF
jgi:hypothetical protein